MNAAPRHTMLAIVFTIPVAGLVLFFIRLSTSADLDGCESDQLRIGYSVEAPFAYVTPQGEVTGESPEFAKAIARRLGISELVWVQTEFSRLIPDLLSCRFDVIAAGLYITPERARKVVFSEPTIHVRQALLVRKGNPLALHSYEALIRNPTVKTAVLAESVELALLQAHGLGPDRLVVVPDVLTGRIAIENGIAAALALTHHTAQELARSGKLNNLEPAAPFHQPSWKEAARMGFVGLAFRKSETDRLDEWNREIRNFVGSAEHLSLLNRFGFTADDLPGTMQTQHLVEEK